MMNANLLTACASDRLQFTCGVFLVIAIGGCGYWVDPREREADAVFEQYSVLEAALENAANEVPRPADVAVQPIATPEQRLEGSTLQILDLELTLRLVKFKPAIEQCNALYFSETEITNGMYAAFLNATGKWRDDTAVEQANDMMNRGIVSPDGSIHAVSSTGSPAVHVLQPEKLWRKGEFPAGEDVFPVTFITTEQAQHFCDWLNARYELAGVFRLPTEEEWVAAAYGAERKYPWGDEKRRWTSPSTEPVKVRPELRTPDGLYGMWGNVSELVGSKSNGYGGEIRGDRAPMITMWLGASCHEETVRGLTTQPRQDYWGYTHSRKSRSDAWGFRIVYAPEL